MKLVSTSSSALLLPLGLFLTLVIVAACGDPASSETEATAGGADEQVSSTELEGTVYGDGVTLAQRVQVSELLNEPDTFAGKRVRLEGTVVGVCAKRGCWFDIAGDGEFQSIRFKVVDGVMTFPMSMKGKYAVLEGTAELIEMNLEDTRASHAHAAEESGESFDPMSITEPESYVRIAGLGAVVRDTQ